MQNAVLLQREAGKEKGTQEASVGRECFRNYRLTAAGFPRPQDEDASRLWHL